MPLGIENNGVSAGLIERGGDFLAQSLIDTGKTIETALIRGQAYRQAREFGQQLSQIDPQSDQWPQQAAFLTSQYPLAVQSGLAKEIMVGPAKAFAGFQAAKRVTQEIQGRKDVAALHGPTGNQPIYTGGGSGPRPTGFGLGPLELPDSVTPGQPQGISGVLQDTFSVMKGDQPAPEVVTNADNGVVAPAGDIPDAATGMQRRSSRPLQSYIDQYSQTYNDALAAKKAPQFRPSQITTIAKAQKAADDKEISGLNAAPKVKATLSDADGNLYREMVDGNFLYPDGTRHLAAPKGLTRVGGAHEQDRLDQAKEAFDYKKERNVQADAAKEAARQEALKKWQESSEGKGLKATTDLLNTRETREVNTLRDYEKQRDKNTDPDKAPELMARVVAQQKLAQQTKDQHSAAAAAYTRMMNAAGTVYQSEQEALAAGHQSGDIIMMINPATGKPAKARLK